MPKKAATVGRRRGQNAAKSTSSSSNTGFISATCAFIIIFVGTMFRSSNSPCSPIQATNVLTHTLDRAQNLITVAAKYAYEGRATFLSQDLHQVATLLDIPIKLSDTIITSHNQIVEAVNACSQGPKREECAEMINTIDDNLAHINLLETKLQHVNKVLTCTLCEDYDLKHDPRHKKCLGFMPRHLNPSDRHDEMKVIKSYCPSSDCNPFVRQLDALEFRRGPLVISKVKGRYMKAKQVLESSGCGQLTKTTEYCKCDEGVVWNLKRHLRAVNEDLKLRTVGSG